MEHSTSDTPPSPTKDESVDPQPLAFTVTFGDDKNQKFDLRGGLHQFAPTKKLANRHSSAKSKKTSVASPVNAKPQDGVFKGCGSSRSKEPAYSQNNGNNNTTNKSSNSNNINNNISNNQGAYKGKNFITDNNNISGHNDGIEDDETCLVQSNPRDTGSDTGTYTIDEDEPVILDDRAKIGAVFGVPGHVLTNEEKILQWASGSSTTTATPTPSCSSNSQASVRRDSPTIDKDETSRSRRKLPATPGLQSASEKQVGSPHAFQKNTTSRPDSKSRLPIDLSSCPRDTPETTDTFLEDTMSVMAAMEARIEQYSGNDLKGKKGQCDRSFEKVGHDFDDYELNKRRTYQDQSERQYHVIKSEDTASDSCCSSTTDASRHVSPHNYNVKTSKSSSLESPSNATRTNRAFALRKKMNSGKGSISISTQATLPFQGKPNRGDNQSGFSRDHKAKTFLPLRSQKKASISEIRSSSSLSAREANFQAWKRRQSYKPNFAIGNMSKSTVSPARVDQGCSRKDIRREGNSLTTPEDDKAMPIMTRSASFHYPDGLSRRQNNVYTSDESDDSLAAETKWPGRDLLEVTEDEFFLPIEDEVSVQRGIRNTRNHHTSTPLKTLDNIVISTIFSVSAKLCSNTSSIIRKMKTQVDPLEEDHVVLDTLVRITFLFS